MFKKYSKHKSEKPFKSYMERLRDPRWQKMRAEILQRDNYTCQVCFDKESTLNVHHRFYLKGRDPWEYKHESLITLCEKCHKEVEEDSDFVKERISAPGCNFDAMRRMADILTGDTDPFFLDLSYRTFDDVMNLYLSLLDAPASKHRCLIDEIRNSTLHLISLLTEANRECTTYMISHPDFEAPWKPKKQPEQ